MDKAKAAVSDFMSKSGHHDTTVHEKVAPAVTRETVNPTRHENITTAVDKETHQDHYHTSVQPVHDREVLPEQHTHNLAGVQHKEHHHGNERDVTSRLQQEAAQFKNERNVASTRETQSIAPTVQGEHIHHHVHETIQPVVHKETIQPNVVHTTVPIHEVHHNAAQHHSTSALPAVSMSDFKHQGGVLGGREERYDGFEGQPRSVGGALGSGNHHNNGVTGAHNGAGVGSHNGNHTGSHTGAGVGAGVVGTGAVGAGAAAHQHGAGHRQHRSGSISSSDEEKSGLRKNKAKPSLMDKINPKVDANGDGKAGFMK